MNDVEVGTTHAVQDPAALVGTERCVEIENTVPPRRPHWGALTAIAVIVPVIILAIIEVSLRIAGVGYSTDLLVPCTVRGVPSSCYNLFFGAPFFPAGMVQVPRLYSIPTSKAPHTYRIFVLGESAAMGDPDPAYGFSRYLEVMLRQRYPAMQFEVVNTGSVAINSHVVLRIAEGLADQHPDLFIIYSGNNEVVGPYGPGTVFSSSAMSMPVVRASIFYHSSRIGQFVTRLGTQKKDWHGMEMFLDKQVPANSPLMKSVYSNYEQNLRDTIDVAAKTGARIIVATAATNLEDCAPFASLHRQNLSAEDLRSWTSLFQKANELEASQFHREALRVYEQAADIDDEYAELEFRIARSLKNLGDYKSAREHFIRARDLDTLRFRADSRINDINRSALAPGITELDTEALFTQASVDGIIGSDLVYEHVHMTPWGSYLLAKAMLSQVTRQLPASAGDAAPNDVLSEAECERLLALTNYDRSRIAGEMARRSQQAPFTNQVNNADQVLRFSLQAQSFKESPNDTALQYQWALSKSPEDHMLHYNYGMFLFPYNRNGSAQELGMAQPWDGFPVFLPDGTQVK